MVNKIIVLGGGSAGFIAALTLKSRLPALHVLVIRSKEIGIIGVGEGSTFALTRFLHDYLRVDEKKFFDIARPSFKLGLRFVWGTRPYFNYTFGPGPELMTPELPKSCGFYADEDMEYWDLYSSMMTHDRAFERAGIGPKFHNSLAYHFENEKFVRFLEDAAQAAGVEIVDDTVLEVKQDEQGISGLVLKSGTTQAADLYVDSSGFASVLLSKTLGEPFISFKTSLFCDRAVVGGWDRTDEVIKPYTTCETMDSGWCWQIEHENRINRGYVYSSAFISDEQAEREFRTKNPKVAATRPVRFVSGRYERRWVKNVVAIGNASGFVEPLEATALGVIALQSRHLTQTLIESDRQPTTTQIACTNVDHALEWDAIRRFIAIHYKYNKRLETPFWRECWEKTDLAGAERIVEYYRENGPAPYWVSTLFTGNDQFGFAGYAALLMGQQVPFRKTHLPSESERRTWQARRQRNKEAALRAMTVKETLDLLHSPKWKWVKDGAK
jgi:tryptophan halogenase